MNTKLKVLVIALACIIIVIFGVLIFVPSAQGPKRGPEPGAFASSDGHVVVSEPNSSEVVSSPVEIAGTVTGGGWFFEASFPVIVVDADETTLGQGTAHATGDWMTTGTVPFVANVTFAKPHSANGRIVLVKDNPSGLPQNAMVFSFPVRFSTSGGTGIVRGTVVLSPTCPVEKNPPDPQCAPKPFSTTIGVSQNIETPTAFKTVQSDASGSFQFVLPPGEYDFFHSNGTSAYPRCGENVIEVVAGKTSDITISCDTGIR
jgi:hypothetical protein